MRIQYFYAGSLQQFSPGGLRTANVVRALASSGHVVELITADRDETALSGAAVAFDLPAGVSPHAGGAARRGALLDRFPRRLNPFARVPARGVRPDVLFLSGTNSLTFARLRRYARDLDVPFVIDLDEWMELSSFSLTSWATLFPVRYEWFMRRLPALAPNAVAISQEFVRYLEEGGGRALVLPPLHEPARRPERATPYPRDEVGSAAPPRTRILVPGVRKTGHGKDRLNLHLLLEALRCDPHLGEQLAFDVVGGVDDDRARDALHRLADLAEVRDHGRVPWTRSKAVLSSADWLLALRDPSARRLRFAFPSKVSEALVAGTPVIVNGYSDMESVVRPGVTGIIVDGLDGPSLATALRDAIARPLERSEVARAAARTFSPAAAGAALDVFLREVLASHVRSESRRRTWR